MPSPILLFADFRNLAGQPYAPSPAPTVHIRRIERATGTESLVAAAGTSTTASAITGRYSYRITGADLNIYDYHALFSTTDGNARDQHQPSIQVNWSEAQRDAGYTSTRAEYLDRIDATVSSRATPAQTRTEADAALAAVGLTNTVTGRMDAAISSRSTYSGADTAGTATLLTRLTAARAGYLDKLNVSGTLAHSDAASLYKIDAADLADAITAGLNTYGAATAAQVAALPAPLDAAATQAACEAAYETVGGTAEQFADAILSRDWTEIAEEPPRYSLWSAARVLACRVDALEGQDLTVYREDGTTVAWTALTLADADAPAIVAVRPY